MDKVFMLSELNKSRTSRLYQRLINNEERWAIISSDMPNNEIDAIKLARDGKSALQSLKNEVRVEYGLGYTHLIFRWVDSDGKKYDEETLIIYGISCKDALALGVKHEQKSIIVKDDKGCKKVVLTDCFDNIRRAVNLEGIYEVYPPRQSYFHTGYSIEKVFENKQIGSIAN